ncbi:MAG: ATP-binding protein, partial [Candidatus Cloacimonadota bacterium]|nr:ATP-binding protein [Candidatus Cloacimonadota bacterium]
GEGIVGAVIETQEPIVVNDVSKDTRFFKGADKSSGFVTKSILCVPLITEKQIWGAIEVINKINGKDFSSRDMEFLQIIAGQSAISIENATLHERIVQSEKMAAIGQTITGLAHCIKNVLQGVDAGTYILNKGIDKEDFDTIHKGWELVKDNNEFIKNLVLDMLSYSQKRNPVYEVKDINELLSSTLKLFHQKAQLNGIRFQKIFDPDLMFVQVDQMGIKRCIINLLTNAFDAISDNPEGKITVQTEKIDEDNFAVKISDDGTGIDEESIPKLFDTFFSTKGAKGTGLGLAVTKKIISEHKGNISVVSEKGVGTTFSITLPIRDSATPILTKEPAQRRKLQDVIKKKKILIIDDKEQNIELTMELLDEIGDFSYQSSLDGYDGLIKAEEFQPDLILLDVQMSGMNGFQVFQ